MESAFIALGSNEGDRETTLRAARNILQQSAGFNLLASSALYDTDPVGGPEGQGPFLNAVVAATTSLQPADLLALCHGIEERFGRQRKEPWGPRTLDLDLLLYGERIVDSPDLILPHPRMHERRFVLDPLQDLAPDLVHPIMKKSVRRLLAELDGAEKVRCLTKEW